MIREIINFTKDLLEVFPDILQWNAKPNGGLYVFVHLDNEGHWDSSNMVYGKDYFYINAKNADSVECLFKILNYEKQIKRVGTSMNKVIDPKGKISSCSPFAVSFRRKFLYDKSLDGIETDKILNLLPNYFKATQIFCTNETQLQFSSMLQNVCQVILGYLSQLKLLSGSKEVRYFDAMKDDEYISFFLDNVPIKDYIETHDNYFNKRLFNKNDFNYEYQKVLYGLSDFLNGTNNKKPFLIHKTASMYEGINGRITSDEAVLLNIFDTLVNDGTLPNPLPIVIDKKEINGKIISIFNKGGKKGYAEILKSVFENNSPKYLSDYYLLNYSKRKSIIINDIDFVPLFRFNLAPAMKLKNLFEAGRKKENGDFIYEPDTTLSDIFDFERVVVKEIFNNALVVENDKGMKTRYFDEIDPKYVRGGDLMYQLILKYRKAFYDYIYKSKLNALNVQMFDDMMFTSILSNIRTDDVKESFSNNPTIKRKLNIWSSLYSLFNNINNNINTEFMASKITELLAKMRQVAQGEATNEIPEEFAFAAGQIVSFLIDRSAASNKTYSMLEPYLQKTKSGHLQDAIAHTVSIYKHNISTYKGAFQQLASNVLTCEGNLEMKPLLKFFLAGCFSYCVIYDKKITFNYEEV